MWKSILFASARWPSFFQRKPQLVYNDCVYTDPTMESTDGKTSLLTPIAPGVAVVQLPRWARDNSLSAKWARNRVRLVVASALLLLAGYLAWHFAPYPSLSQKLGGLLPAGHGSVSGEGVSRTRDYSLTIGQAWKNPDGGLWRVYPTCNGDLPCPVLVAEEGDVMNVHVQNDMYTQESIHISGLSHQSSGPWRDGTSGLTQYALLPRANATYTYDTAGRWGFHWYIEHIMWQGLYGAVWVAPAPDRMRPYAQLAESHCGGRQSTTTAEQLMADMLEAERNAQHLLIKDNADRDPVWRILRMRAEGSEIHCADSLLVNGKGRLHCAQPGYDVIDGQKTDESGCLLPRGQKPLKCKPTFTDYEVIHTAGRRYIMLNLLNSGFEHAIKVSIDAHRMTVVANDGGFVKPETADVVYLPNGSRLTVLVKLLDSTVNPGDFAIRVSSTSSHQNLQGYALLRYPGNHYPRYGEPMALPVPDTDEHICLDPAGETLGPHCTTLSAMDLTPLVPDPPPRESTLTRRLLASSRPSKTDPHVDEFFLNKQPWQLYHAMKAPLLLLDPASSAPGDPVMADVPLGAVVDLVIENDVDEPVPLYKHAPAYWLLGSGEGRFPFTDAAEAVAAGSGLLNVENPPRLLVHELPPRGWSVVRFRVDEQAATMLHAMKMKWFGFGMSVPILEGITKDHVVGDIPDYVKDQPHVDFEPKNEGIFG